MSLQRLPIGFPGLAFATAAILTLVSPPQPAGGQTRPLASVADAPALARMWDAEHLDDGPPALLDHDTLVQRLAAAVREGDGLYRTEQIGQSVEGRSINHVWFGRGPVHILLWSQMHGDEPTATSALLDILHLVARHRSEPSFERMLDRLTLHLVPMLNPDGAARFQRRNAQGIDINRDALLLQTPEGVALKALRDRLKPSLGFNLHNQNWRTSAGKAGPASISLLAAAFDEARTETPGRLLAKRTCTVIRDALESLVPGQVGRYDDEFEVRAFGDNLTKWGTPVVLIETGPAAGDKADQALVKLNVVAILSAIDALATGRVENADAARYASLPVNESNLFTVLIRNASIVTGTGISPFTGDIGLGSSRIVRRSGPEAARTVVQAFRIEDLGDLRTYVGLETIDATGLFVVANAGWKERGEVRIDDWKTFKSERPLASGVAMDLALLREAAPGMYRVERIIRAERNLGSAR